MKAFKAWFNILIISVLSLLWCAANMEYIFLNEILARLREEDEESLVMI
jgi:hypothetical protein